MALTTIAASENSNITINSSRSVLYISTNGAGSATLKAISGCGNFTSVEFSGQRTFSFQFGGIVNLSMSTGGGCNYDLSHGKGTGEVYPASIATNISGDNFGIIGGDGYVRNPLAQSRFLSKASKLQLDYTDPALTLGLTACTRTLDKAYQRFTNYTARFDASANTAIVSKGTQTITCDPADKMLSIDMYFPFAPAVPGTSVVITLCNSNGFTVNNLVFSFNLNYIQEGWNTLRMWQGDTDAAAGMGTLAYGATKSTGGTGCDMAANIGFIEMAFYNMSGRSVYVDTLRRSAKMSPCLVIGFDATSNSASDNCFVDGVAPLFKRFGASSYFTINSEWDILYAHPASDAIRKFKLMDEFNWTPINHTWTHGGTIIGATPTVTLNRVSNLVTVTYPAVHGLAIGKKFHSAILGATQSDLNGVFEFTVTTTLAATYTAAGVDGAGTGTIKLSSILQDVVPSPSTLSTQILTKEIAMCSQHMRAAGFYKGAKIGAYPNNSAPDLTTLQAVCKDADIKLFRGSRGGTIKFNEFGIANPLHFGSFELGSGISATTLQFIKDKITGIIGRGEHMWLYGHYILDENDPANAAHANANLEYPPGSGGNPAASAANPLGGGWWYLGQLRRLFEESIVPNNIPVLNPLEWAASIGVDV
jgi:hypothetical protein